LCGRKPPPFPPENGELIIENVVGSQLAVCQPCRF
jgi:hypothetical protein